MVPMALGLAARASLEEHGNPVEWHDYPIEHSVSAEELRDVGRWLTSVLG